MKWLFLFISLAVALERVNDYNFDKAVIKSGDYVLVDFYADWCRHCQKLMPTIEKLAESYEDVPGVKVVKFNGGERSGRKMVLKYNVEGFPALGLFHDKDEPVFYEGSRDFESINNFLKLKTGVNEVANPEIQAVQLDNRILRVDDNNIQNLVLNSDKKTLLFVTGHWCGHCKEFKPIFNQLHEIYSADDEIQFGIVDLDTKHHTTDKIRGLFGVETVPGILLFDASKVGEDGLRRPTKYEGKRKLPEVVKFLNEQLGLHRALDGTLDSSAGRVTEIEQKIKAIQNSEEAQAYASLLQQEQDYESRYYGSVLHKLTHKQDIIAETKRLTGLTTKFEHIHASQRDEIMKRINILKFYQSAGLNF